MRVAYLAAGAGGMYCGSCLRDNRMAATLIRRGRDVVLIPLYTPLKTDEENVSKPRVFYGGINSFLQQKSAIFRHTPWFLDRLLNTRLLFKLTENMASTVRPELLGSLTVSVLKGEHGAQLKELQKLIAGLRQIQPTIIVLPNLMLAGIAHELKAALGVPVLCSLAGEDIFLDQLTQPFLDQAFGLIKDASRHVDGFVAPTRYYAEHCVEHFGLDPDKIHLVTMGIGVDDIKTPNDLKAQPFRLGYLARICPEKGLANLAKAYVSLRQAGRNCRLEAAGYLGKADRQYFKDTLALLAKEGVEDGFEYLGEVSRAQKIEMLRSIHVFSVPAEYHESKGLSVLEAMACGVPVVQPRHGAYPEFVEATGGGLLYDPGDPDALAASIARLMDEADLRRDLGARAWEGVRAGFTDEIMADQMWSVLEKFKGTGGAHPRGSSMLQAEGIKKAYPTRSGELVVISDISVSLKEGEALAIMGPSGSGKSTLLNILGTLEPPSAGQVRIDDVEPFALSEKELAIFRNRHIGFVFQESHLLPQCTVLENVLLPTLADAGSAGAAERAGELLARVGLSDRLEHRPAELSGGERQRVAIARALINKPALVLADEPTGNLDRHSARNVADLLVELHRDEQAMLIVVTHSQELAARFDRRYEILDGKLVEA